MKQNYEDIINLPHPVSKSHPQMPMKERAAQFAPFQALTGYGSAIKETERITLPRLELSESSQEEIKRKLDWIEEHIAERPAVKMTYFRPDEKKDGGSYVIKEGKVKRIDAVTSMIHFEDREAIPIRDLLFLELKN